MKNSLHFIYATIILILISIIAYQHCPFHNQCPLPAKKTKSTNRLWQDAYLQKAGFQKLAIRNGFIQIYYQVNSATKILLPPNEGKDSQGNYSGPDLPLIETKLDKALSQTYQIHYTDGPSDDPGFVFYSRDENGSYKVMGYSEGISGERLILPGDGRIVIEGESDNSYDNIRQFTVSENEIVETKQPLYAVNIKSTAHKDFVIYSDQALTQPLTTIKKDSVVFVLANLPGETQDDTSYFYLIQNELGVAGWAKLPTPSCGMTIDQEDPLGLMVEDICFNGD